MWGGLYHYENNKGDLSMNNKKGIIQWVFVGVAILIVIIYIFFSKSGFNQSKIYDGKPCIYKSFDFADSACINGKSVYCDSGRFTESKCIYGCGIVSGQINLYGCVYSDKPFIKDSPNILTILSEKEANPLNNICDSFDDSYCYQGNYYSCRESSGRFGREVCTHGNCEELPSGSAKCPLLR